MSKEVIKIVIADDHELIRQGIKRIISFEEDLAVVGEAENGIKLLNILNSCKPHVVLLDMNMPIMNGIDTLREIKKEKSMFKVIMLTVEADNKIIHEAIEFGADGYILKESAGEEIVNAIRLVYNNEKYIDKSLVALLFSEIKGKSKKAESVLDKLSKREIEVLMKISKGLSNKEIGQQLFLSEKTIKNYATNLFRKINVDDRVQATILALENGIEDYYKSKYEA